MRGSTLGGDVGQESRGSAEVLWEVITAKISEWDRRWLFSSRRGGFATWRWYTFRERCGVFDGEVVLFEK